MGEAGREFLGKGSRVRVAKKRVARRISSVTTIGNATQRNVPCPAPVLRLYRYCALLCCAVRPRRSSGWVGAYALSPLGAANKQGIELRQENKGREMGMGMGKGRGKSNASPEFGNSMQIGTRTTIGKKKGQERACAGRSRQSSDD